MLFSNSQFSLCLITLLPFAPMGTKDILIQQLIISCPGQGCLHCCFHSWRTHAQGLNAWSTGNFYWETLKKQYHPGQSEEVTSDPSPYFAFGSVLTVSSLQKHMRVFFIVVCMEAFIVLEGVSEVWHGQVGARRWTCGSTVCVCIYSIFICVDNGFSSTSDWKVIGEDYWHLTGAITDGHICYMTSVLHQNCSTCGVISSSAVCMDLVIGCILLSEVTSSVTLIS